jgi:hypothetical protein
MGNIRGITADSAWTAIVAGFGWLLSGALFATLTWFNILPATFVRLLVPETIAATAWRSVMPWPVLIPALSMLTLVGLMVLLLRPALPNPAAAQPTPAGKPASTPVFMTVWLCVVLSSFVTSVLWSAGGILAQWPPMRAAMLFSSVETALLSAGYWGIVWGWVPALAWALLARRRGGAVRTVRAGRAGHRSAVAVLAGATAACAVLLVAAAPLSGAATRAASAAQVRPSPSQSPSTPPVVYGSPLVGPAQQPPETDWCRGEQVAISLGQPDAAASHRGMPIKLTNKGGTPCVLTSYPDVAFDDTAGWAMEVLLVQGGSFATKDPGVHRVTVLPGASAEAFLGWNAQAGAGDTRVGTVLVAPYTGAARSSSAISLDIGNGGVAAVTAWSLPKSAG